MSLMATSSSIARFPGAGLLTRRQVADQLGVGITTIHRMRLRGDLHPVCGDNGVWRYDPADVLRAMGRVGLPKNATPGQVSAVVFQMFEDGASLREIVMRLHIDPEEVRRLYHWWRTPLREGAPEPERAAAPPRPPV